MPALKGREKEFAALMQFLQHRWNGQTRDALFIFGSSGQGKTATLRSVEGADISAKIGTSKRFEIAEINCGNLSSRGLRIAIWEQLQSFYNKVKLPTTPKDVRSAPTRPESQLNAIDELLAKMCERYRVLPPESSRKHLVLHLDEVDYTTSTSTTKEILARFLEATKGSNHCPVSLILMSNGRAKILASDRIRELCFETYTTAQLKDIGLLLSSTDAPAAPSSTAKTTRKTTAAGALGGETSSVSDGLRSSSTTTATTTATLHKVAVDFIAKSNVAGDVRNVKDLIDAGVRRASKRTREQQEREEKEKPTRPTVVHTAATSRTSSASGQRTSSSLKQEQRDSGEGRKTIPLEVTIADVAAASKDAANNLANIGMLPLDNLLFVCCCAMLKNEAQPLYDDVATTKSTAEQNQLSVQEVTRRYNMLRQKLKMVPKTLQWAKECVSSLHDYDLATRAEGDRFQLKMHLSELSIALKSQNSPGFEVARGVLTS